MDRQVDPDAIINPSSGLYGRNPSHIEEAADADDQDDIVKAIKQTGTQRMRVRYEYKNMDKLNPPPMHGIVKIKSMDETEATEFGKTLMRSHPNIFRTHIKLGDYPQQRRIDNAKTRTLNSQKPRFHTEIGAKIGELLVDKGMFITEIKYAVNNADPGFFSATAEVYGTTEKEYYDENLFNPTIELEFVKL